ncbi:hypothetical protein XFF6992_710022 [Xanthomonas citri pv. fuscans]|nr:hypothetical protein XFF6992_190100 [Xanthomonas citri pv. fuscans]SOO18788.1 hypothetical protein XFF6992_260097 [Xanthomonas citri pv. fuscans]SOO21707.1 hypothetical protein XFF6992_710022 [Xanthomonas citri pv. fuscans]SOO30675.1 hypothetical protein XFF6994_1130003 [Xanthomonas citri pv. fuscans]
MIHFQSRRTSYASNTKDSTLTL